MRAKRGKNELPHLLGGGGFRYALGPFAATVAEIGDDFAAAAQDRQFAVVGAVMAPLAGGGDLLFAEAPADEVGRSAGVDKFLPDQEGGAQGAHHVIVFGGNHLVAQDLLEGPANAAVGGDPALEDDGREDLLAFPHII